MRDEPHVRRNQWDGDADDRDQPDDGNAGDVELSEHAYEPGQLHGDDAERDGDDYQQHMDGEHDGNHDHGEFGATGSTAYTIKYWCGGY